MSAIQALIAAVREERRADYLMDTKVSAQALGIEPGRYGEWWYRTREKLVVLCIVQPGQVAAEMLAIIAEAEDRRQKFEEEAKAKT